MGSLTSGLETGSWSAFRGLVLGRVRIPLRHVRFFETLQAVTHQAPLSMGFSRQEYWSGLPCPPPGDLPNPGTELASPEPLALTGDLFTTVPPGKPLQSQKDSQLCRFYF